jgi:transcriptional regulator with XRE-family HTH domain
VGATNLSLANVGVNKAATPPVSDDPKHAQPHYPLWLRRQWKDFVCARMQEKQLTQNALAEAAGIDPSYVWLIRRGWIPKRDKVEQIGRALGDSDGTLRAAGMHLAPEFPLSQAALDLFQLLSLIRPEEQERAIKSALIGLKKALRREAAAC